MKANTVFLQGRFGRLLANPMGIAAMKTAIKKATIRSGVLRIASRMGSHRVAILRYHSVLAEPERFGNSIGCGIIHSRNLFAEHMALIASHYRPVSIDEVCAFVSGGAGLPHHCVTVTFDDGFADNLEFAAPILARYGIPASIYIAVDYIGNRTPPWYCRLRYAFSVSRIPEWRVGDFVFDMSIAEQRRQAFLDSSRRCAKLCRESQENLLAEVEHRLDVEPFSTPMMLTWDGVRELIALGHTIGSHTLSHPNLAYVGATDHAAEIAASKAEIEKNIGTEVKHFSYPSPIMEPHYSDETIAATKAAGYRSAVTCSPGAVVKGDNALTLKRVFAPQTVAELEWSLENAFVGRLV